VPNANVLSVKNNKIPHFDLVAARFSDGDLKFQRRSSLVRLPFRHFSAERREVGVWFTFKRALAASFALGDDPVGGGLAEFIKHRWRDHLIILSQSATISIPDYCRDAVLGLPLSPQFLFLSPGA